MNLRRGWLLYIFLVFGANVLFSQEKKEDAFNLGLLGAEGIVQKEGEIQLTQIFEKTPAFLAGLKTGAIILLDLPQEEMLTKTPPKELEDTEYDSENSNFTSFSGISKETQQKEKLIFHLIKKIEEASETTGKLVLKVQQGGTTKEYTIKIPKYGKHSETCPKKCKRCNMMVQLSLKWLAENQNGGVWETSLGGQNGNVVVTSVCGLALLASGSYPSGPYAKEIKMALKYVLRYAGKEDEKPTSGANWRQVNWTLGYAPLFLAECYARTPTAEIRNKLLELSQLISKNQETSGGWAHGPGGPNALGYVELEIMSNWCLASLGMIQAVKVPVQTETIQTGLDYIVQCSSEEGGVGYSTREGQKGFGDPGRTAGAIFAFAMLQQKKHSFYPKMSDYLLKNIKEVPNGHVSPVMHFMATALACHQLEDSFQKEFWTQFQLEFLSARRFDGSFASRPTEESTKMRSNTDLDLGANWITGNYLIVLLLHENKLKLFQKD